MIGSNLKYLRERDGLEQSEMLAAVGVAGGTWSDYERGKSKPKPEVLVKISEFFRVDLKQLIVDDLSNVHLKGQNADAGKIGNNVHPNVHPDVHLKGQNAANTATNQGTTNSPQQGELFWRDRFYELLEKVTAERANYDALSKRSEGVLPLIYGMHHFLLQLAAEARHTPLEAEAMRLNKIMAEQLGIPQKTDTPVDVHK